MKRTLLASLCVLALASVSYAAGGIPATTKGQKTFTFKPSTNVNVSYYVDGSTNNNQNYTANTKNTAGNRVYSSSNNTSNIWYKELDSYKGQTLSATSAQQTTAGYSDYAANNWSSQ